MEAERWQRVKSLFHELLDRPTVERDGFLETACGTDRALRAEIESLLHSHRDAGTFLEYGPTLPAELAAAAGDGEAADARIGQRIGAYELVRSLGRGGMGTVYLGRRADGQFAQEVAIKLVRRGMDTELLLQRFRAEREILARFDHPNISRILDAGASADGLPYFVMEYIDGEPIDRHCQRNDLSIPQRLALFIQVCNAVQYAHQNLVVHRDLKPSNVLVTATGLPKLVDFGIAKLLGPEASETASELRLMTPEYASPEQIRGGPVTTGTDVHALGALLYELLAGQSPFACFATDPAGLARAILDQDPPPPSHAPSVPRRLRRALGGDLDTIVAVALRKDPGRRYASAEQFAADVRRHLRREPVTARRDTLAYRAARFVARHWLGVGVAIAVAAVLVAGIGITIAQARIARQERARADTARREAQQRVAELHEEQGRQALLAGQPGQALLYLVEAQALGRRTLVGRYLVGQATRVMSAQLATMTGHRRAVWNLGFSPDGQRLVTASNDGTARVWDARGRTLFALAHLGPVRRASFSPDGARIVTASADRTAGIWDATSGALVHTLHHDDRVLTAAWSPDGARILTASQDRTAALWLAANGTRIATLRGHGVLVRVAAWSPDGTRAVTASDDGQVRVWDRDGRALSIIAAHPGQEVKSVAFRHDGTRFVTASGDGTAAIWDAASGALVVRLSGHNDQVFDAEFAPDGDQLVTASADGRARIWGLDGSPQRDLDHPGLVWSAAFSPDGARIVTAGGDGVARVFDRRGTELSRLAGHGDQARRAVFDPSGQLIAVAVFDGTATLWRAQPPQLLFDLHASGHEPMAARFSPDGRRVASAGRDGSVRVWDAGRGTPVASLESRHTGRPLAWSRDGGHLATASGRSAEVVATDGWIAATVVTGSEILGVAFTPDGERLLTAAEDGVRAWDLRTGALAQVLSPAAARCVEVSPDGQRIAACGEGVVPLWDPLGRALPPLPVELKVTQSLAFDGAAERIVVAGRERVAHVYSLAARRLLIPLEGHTSEILRVAFSPDGHRVATGGVDGVVRVLDAATGKVLERFPHADPVTAVDFAPRGDRLLTLGEGDRAAVWDISPDDRATAELRALVRCRVPYRLVRGHALPAPIDAKELCP